MTFNEWWEYTNDRGVTKNPRLSPKEVRDKYFDYQGEEESKRKESKRIGSKNKGKSGKKIGRVERVKRVKRDEQNSKKANPLRERWEAMGKSTTERPKFPLRNNLSQFLHCT